LFSTWSALQVYRVRTISQSMGITREFATSDMKRAIPVVDKTLHRKNGILIRNLLGTRFDTWSGGHS
jgi:hypothetical protein